VNERGGSLEVEVGKYTLHPSLVLEPLEWEVYARDAFCCLHGVTDYGWYY
jgi:hypothetical protein